MNKKEFTKKQLKKQLTTLTEEKSARSETALKKDLKNSFDALKKLDQVTTGQKIGDVTITKAMNKKIKNAKRYIEDLYDNITDGEIQEKEQNEENEVTERNENSEGYGKMYNALEGIREDKVVKINENTLRRIVERVITEREDWMGKVDKDIEKRGTEGDFRDWCIDHGFEDGCSKGCWDAAKKEGGIWSKRAGLAKAYCEAK